MFESCRVYHYVGIVRAAMLGGSLFNLIVVRICVINALIPSPPPIPRMESTMCLVIVYEQFNLCFAYISIGIQNSSFIE